MTALRGALQAVGVDQSQYCGHSFRVGVATMAAARGMEDSIIEMLGRWSSVAYLQYVKSPENNCTASYRFQDPVCIESFLRCVQSNIDVFMTYSILIM